MVWATVMDDFFLQQTSMFLLLFYADIIVNTHGLVILLYKFQVGNIAL